MGGNKRVMKEAIHRLLEPSPEGASRTERAVDAAIVSLILLSVAAVVLRTVEELAALDPYLRTFQLVATGVFSIEYLARVYSCTADQRYATPILGRLRFLVTPMAVIDLMAVLPFYLLELLAPGSKYAGAVLMLRMLRLFKLYRYSRSMTLFARVLKEKADQLIATLLIAGMALVLFSSLVYFSERAAQPRAFASIPTTMWWGVMTITTVGEGTVSPITPAGRLFAALTALVGVAIVAVPSGILASGFVEVLSAGRDGRRRKPARGGVEANGWREERCPCCGRPFE